VVITDVMLPDLDGLAMASQIKATPDTAPIPVVFLTLFQAETHREQATELGATYLSKPIKPEAFLKTVNRLLAG
jgi:putative two-component system response regulator